MSINIKGLGNVGGISENRNQRAEQQPRNVDAKASKDAASDDAVALSPEAKRLRDVEATVRNLPDVDAGRVDAIRAAVAEGRYHVDPDKVAAKIIELEGELNL